jgi:thymidylate synthase (FAD)
MSVRLIAYTTPVIPECQDPADLIAYCARVSNPSNQSNKTTAPKLIAYLADHQHWSPFEMSSLTMEIRTTRDIARQILRHRSFSFQEFSQRYAEVKSCWVPREARLQDMKNRQNSLETDKEGLKRWWMAVQDKVAETANEAYEAALANGLAKEVARAVLPEGLTESVIYMAGTVRSWIHYVQLRCATGTQKEHQQIAQQCRAILLSEFPDLKGIM